jgi:hypothetical protein
VNELGVPAFGVAAERREKPHDHATVPIDRHLPDTPVVPQPILKLEHPAIECWRGNLRLASDDLALAEKLEKPTHLAHPADTLLVRRVPKHRLPSTTVASQSVTDAAGRQPSNDKKWFSLGLHGRLTPSQAKPRTWSSTRLSPGRSASTRRLVIVARSTGRRFLLRLSVMWSPLVNPKKTAVH